MLMKIKRSVSDIRGVELDNMMEIGITDFLLLADKFCEVNDGDG
jgi:hypothetical protein